MENRIILTPLIPLSIPACRLRPEAQPEGQARSDGEGETLRQKRREGVRMICFLLLCLAFPSLAQEIPVKVKADQLKYIEETETIQASGSVEVRFKEATIYADFLRMDSRSNIATAEGRVKMVARNYQSSCDQLVYDTNSGFSVFQGFSSRLSSGRIKGNLYLSARDLRDFQNKMLGEAGRVTSCDDKVAHYFVLADKLEYYPEDKVIGSNVTVFVGELPVLWAPYMVYDLSREKKRNWVFGHNEVEGDYLKSSWDYPYGTLYLDLMEKKGFGKGTRTDYDFKKLGLGSFFLYHLEEKDTGITDWVTQIKHTKNINPFTTLKLSHEYFATYLIPSGRKDMTSFTLDLGYKDKAKWNLNLKLLDNRLGFQQSNSLQFNQAYEKISTGYYFNYDYAKKSPRWVRASQRFDLSRPLWSDKVKLVAQANYYHNIADEGKIGDEHLVPKIEITGQESAYSWRITEDLYVDLDGDRNTQDNTTPYREKKPEMEVKFNSYDLGLFSLKPTLGYAYYHEVVYVSQLQGMRDFSTHRGQMTLDAGRKIPLPLSTDMVLGAGLDQFFYAPGDQLYAYRERMDLHTMLFGFFRNDINYQKGTTDGNTPFMFDTLGSRYHNVREKMTFYYLDKLNWVFDGGHNWQIHQWFDVDTHLLFKPNRQWHWDLRTGWSIENTRYKDLVNVLKLFPYSFLSLDFSTVSDLNIGGLKSGSILYDILLLEGQPNQWRLKLGQVYDQNTREFKVRDIMVVKDLHCWQLQYTYSDYRKEFSLTFSLKALPDEPVGISSGRGFYFEGFEKKAKEFKKEGAVRRY